VPDDSIWRRLEAEDAAARAANRTLWPRMVRAWVFSLVVLLGASLVHPIWLKAVILVGVFLAMLGLLLGSKRIRRRRPSRHPRS
jgi:hypothetical protein